jgi:hypothetical protein
MRLWIALLTLGLGCSTSRVSADVDAGGLVVTATTDRSAVATGQSLQITITVANTSGTSRTLQFSSGCLTDYEFLDAGGKVVGTSQQLCLQALTQRTLPAGENFTDSHMWIRGPLGTPQLAPGTYQLRGVLLATRDTVRSQPVPIAIP